MHSAVLPGVGSGHTETFNHSHLLFAAAHPFHTKGYALTTKVYTDDSDANMLMKMNNLGGIADIAVRQLGNMHQTVLMDSDIDEGTKIGYICHYTWQLHPLMKIFKRLYTGIELKGFNLLTRVTARLLQFVHNIG